MICHDLDLVLHSLILLIVFPLEDILGRNMILLLLNVLCTVALVKLNDVVRVVVHIEFVLVVEVQQYIVLHELPNIFEEVPANVLHILMVLEYVKQSLALVLLQHVLVVHIESVVAVVVDDSCSFVAHVEEHHLLHIHCTLQE